MTPRQVNKIYDSLSPYQLATLAYESCIECNEVDSDSILNVINRADAHFVQRYRCRLNLISGLIGLWGMEYWQTMAGIIAFQHVCGSEQQLLKDYSNIGLHHKIAALVAVLRALSAETGISIDTVLTFFSINPETFNAQDKSPNDELNNEYVEKYLNVLNG